MSCIHFLWFVFFLSKLCSSLIMNFRHILATRRIWESANRSVIDFFWPKYYVVIVQRKCQHIELIHDSFFAISITDSCVAAFKICVKGDWAVQKSVVFVECISDRINYSYSDLRIKLKVVKIKPIKRGFLHGHVGNTNVKNLGYWHIRARTRTYIYYKRLKLFTKDLSWESKYLHVHLDWRIYSSISMKKKLKMLQSNLMSLTPSMINIVWHIFNLWRCVQEM